MIRVLLAGGGSGGHVFPALAVASALEQAVAQPPAFLYVGTSGGVESELATAAGVPFAPISARPVRGRNVASQLVSAAATAMGMFDAATVIQRFRPDVVFLTGGYVSAPVGLAAWLLRKPVVLFQPDVSPGWALRMLAPLARRVCVTHERSLERYGERGVVTGYPIREGFRDLDQPLARAHFQLNGGPALLVTGAVRGAQRINAAIADRLPEWLEIAQLIHISARPSMGGSTNCASSSNRDWPAATGSTRTWPRRCRWRWLPATWAISRAGASVLGEYPAAGLPAVLVPLGEAGGHQRFNAEALEASGAAVIVDNDTADRDLFDAATRILADPEQLAAMRDRALELRRLDGGSAIARALLEAAQ